MKLKKEIFLVPYAHLDSQWRWEYPTTIIKYIKNTLDENIRMFAKYEEHRFNFTGALRYQMMKEYFPDRFERVKKLVSEGRWHLAGTCLEETDTLVPSIESNIRNILYGDRWQQNEFGTTSRDYMLPDCFGFPANLPSVLSHCGIKGFSSNKLTWGSAVGIPFEIGMWKGPDGAEMVSAFNPGRYDSHMELPIFLNPGRLKKLQTLGQKNGIWKSFQYYGVGDIGGAPKEISVKNAIRSIRYYHQKASDIEVKQGAGGEFFDCLSPEEKTRMSRYEGDLLLINHSAGSLTSAAIMKRWNRKNEQLAFAAESAAVMAEQMAGLKYPFDKIKLAWERVIGSQMHDILPGTSTPSAYEYSQNDEVLALNGWTSILDDSAEAIAPYVQGKGNLLFFNPTGEQRKELVDFVLDNLDEDKCYVMKDANGTSYPLQVKWLEKQAVGTFKIGLKPFEWSKYDVVEAEHSMASDLTLVESPNSYQLRNTHYQVTVNKDGSVASIVDLMRNREILNTPLAYEFQKERPSKYPAWNMDWADRKKAPFLRLVTAGKVEVIENGFLKKTLRITTKYNNSTFQKEITLGHEADTIEFTERIDWHETGCCLKLAIHSEMEHPTATYNWGSSRVQRGVNHEKQFEVPSRLWVDLSEKDFGFSLFEDSKYGYDRPRPDLLRMTLIYTPAIRYLNGFWDQKSQDWGKHTIRYGIQTHDGNWQKADKTARLFNQKVRTFKVESRVVREPKEMALAEIQKDQLGFSAIKMAENKKGIIVRLYERYGKKCDTTVSFFKTIENAYEVNGLEEKIGDSLFAGKELQVTMPGNGLKAYYVDFGPSTRMKVDQVVLCLPYNTRMIGSNQEEGEAIFPSETMPEVIEGGGVLFRLEKNARFNGLRCYGQILDVPNHYNTISFLMGSKTGEFTGFEWLDKNKNVLEKKTVWVPKLTGFIGLWDTRVWQTPPTHQLENKRDYAWINRCVGVHPGYINRDRVEWYSNHTHDNGKDLPYRYGYLFRSNLMVPDQAAFIRLNDGDSVIIMAATAHQTDVTIGSNQYRHDRFDF